MKKKKSFRRPEADVQTIPHKAATLLHYPKRSGQLTRKLFEESHTVHRTSSIIGSGFLMPNRKKGSEATSLDAMQRIDALADCPVSPSDMIRNQRHTGRLEARRLALGCQISNPEPGNGILGHIALPHSQESIGSSSTECVPSSQLSKHNGVAFDLDARKRGKGII